MRSAHATFKFATVVLGSILLWQCQAPCPEAERNTTTLRIWLDRPSSAVARVYIDGSLVSSALMNGKPVDISVQQGEHTLSVTLEGYKAVSERIMVHNTLLQEFRFSLEKI